ncbi:MAG: exodeoxyribonuclease VII small subunit [Leptospiraceae bacterium]|nr:exodeoxyribonuclease VII small subunit [Leptospiraceae bacterium]
MPTKNSPGNFSEAVAALPPDLTFEQALEQLEAITQKLEEGREPLEKLMQLYEQGLALKEFCEQKLKEAEGKWLMLQKQKDGSVVAKEVPNRSIPESNELQGQIF